MCTNASKRRPFSCCHTAFMPAQPAFLSYTTSSTPANPCNSCASIFPTTQVTRVCGQCRCNACTAATAWQTSPMADKRTKQTDSGGWLNKGIGYPQRGKERWGDYAGAGVQCKIAGFLTHYALFPGPLCNAGNCLPKK